MCRSKWGCAFFGAQFRLRTFYLGWVVTMKRLLSILLSICFIVGALYGCGDRNSTEDKLEFEQLEWPSYNNAKQIPVPKSSMADVRNCNDVRFEFYLANTTLEDFKAYVEECKAKGFVVDAAEQDDRYFAYNEENYELTVSHQEGSIMYVCVVEKRLGVEIKLLHTDNASADLYDLRIEIDGYWEADSKKGDEVITFDTYLREGKHTLIISNDDDGDVSGRLDFTVSSDGEYFEFNIHCMSDKIQINQANSIATVDTNADDNETGDSNIKSTESNENESIVALSSKEADRLFESAFDCLGKLIDDFSEALEYTSFASIEDIQKYEAIWERMSKDAMSAKSMLDEKCPPSSYKKVWDEFSACMGQISEILVKGTDVDTNHDGQYSEEEMSALISAIRDEFVITAGKACDIAKEYLKISEGVNTPDNGNSSNNNSSENECVECGKKATRTYTNPFSGQKEYYCQTHYEKIIEMIGDMEQDVGNGSSSKHTCEECNREGTHSIIGFSGELEYYCTEHYNELMELLEIFG